MFFMQKMCHWSFSWFLLVLPILQHVDFLKAYHREDIEANPCY